MPVYKPYSVKPKDELAFKIYFTKTKINAKFCQLDTGDFRNFTQFIPHYKAGNELLIDCLFPHKIDKSEYLRD